MTTPQMPDELLFFDEEPTGGPEAVTERGEPRFNLTEAYPDAIIRLSDVKRQAIESHIRRWIEDLEAEQAPKQDEFVEIEKAYRARSSGPKDFPFVGACGDVVPLVAMAVDPIHARLDTGIFKSDPVFTLKPLKKSFVDILQSVQKFIEFYQKNRLNLRAVVSPRLLELAKLGTMALKTIYDRDTYSIRTYDTEWNVIDKEVTRFSGPRVVGVPIADLLFPAAYQYFQDVPFCAERQRMTYGRLMQAQASGYLTNVEKLKGQEVLERTPHEEALQEAANHHEADRSDRFLVVYECWFDYDINDDGIEERLVATYSYDNCQLLQLRYNWYFHQRKPYTVIPYSVSNGTLYGIGIGEMSRHFQDSLTKWQQMATDNAYLANIRMYVTRKDSGLEDTLKVYAARNLKVEDPQKDIRELRLSDIYHSTLSERQNIFGLAEKRTGVSDYLTGRESPIVGSRATATSTLALIDEGTKRVEQVLENIRNGLAEVINNCIYLWMQYGLDEIDDIVFGDDQIAADVKTFFGMLNNGNLEGAIAVDLTASDASQNRAAKQQMRLAIINTMMQYLTQVTEMGAQAIQMKDQAPQVAAFYGEVAEASRKMFRDLLNDYDIRNPEEYLPDLEAHLANPSGPGGPGGLEGSAPAAAGPQGVPMVPPGFGGDAGAGLGAAFAGIPTP